MKTSGLNYDTAVVLAARGKRIKRSDWYTWLKEDDAQALRFQLSPDVKKSVGDGYKPTDADLAAEDWQVA